MSATGVPPAPCARAQTRERRKWYADSSTRYRHLRRTCIVNGKREVGWCHDPGRPVARVVDHGSPNYV